MHDTGKISLVSYRKKTKASVGTHAGLIAQVITPDSGGKLSQRE